MESQSPKAHRLGAADAEVNEYFTSSLGLSAQPYEPVTSCGFYSPSLHATMLLRASRGSFSRHDRFAATLRQVDPDFRQTLHLIYAYGTSTMEDGSREVAIDVGRLVIALAPSWGHGSFLRIAVRQDRVIQAFEKRKGNARSIFDFLEQQADRGDETRGWFAKVRSDCEATRREALLAYDAPRKERVLLERGEERRAELERQRLFDESLGRRRRKETERFEARLRGVS